MAYIYKQEVDTKGEWLSIVPVRNNEIMINIEDKFECMLATLSKEQALNLEKSIIEHYND